MTRFQISVLCQYLSFPPKNNQGSKEETLRLDLSIVCIIDQELCSSTGLHLIVFPSHSGFKSLPSCCNYRIIVCIIEIVILACSFSSFIWPQGITQTIKTDIIMSGWSLYFSASSCILFIHFLNVYLILFPCINRRNRVCQCFCRNFLQ